MVIFQLPIKCQPSQHIVGIYLGGSAQINEISCDLRAGGVKKILWPICFHRICGFTGIPRGDTSKAVSFFSVLSFLSFVLICQRPPESKRDNNEPMAYRLRTSQSDKLVCKFCDRLKWCSSWAHTKNTFKITSTASFSFHSRVAYFNEINSVIGT
jgi:hypothetical protein